MHACFCAVHCQRSPYHEKACCEGDCNCHCHKRTNWRVIAKLKHSDGTIEPRRVYLENLNYEDAQKYAAHATSDPLVIEAWAEKK